MSSVDAPRPADPAANGDGAAAAPADRVPLDLAALRRRLAGEGGRRFWRSLEELADTPEFHELLAREFPREASVLAAVDRRQFLKLAGASLALAGLSACTRQPPEEIMPYVRAPEQIVPGQPLYFATALPLAGTALGVLVESHMGRPTKIEGNPQHPGSLGATDRFAQAAVLSLYDPDRAQVVSSAGQIRTWSAFLDALGPVLEAQRAVRGAGLRILTGTVTSPTLGQQIRDLLTEMPAARWHQYEPAACGGGRAGSQIALGRYVDSVYDFSRADVIVSLDADFLECGPGNVRYVRDFSRRRRADGDKPMNRLYVVESTPTVTGAKADHRVPLRASAMLDLARAIAVELGVGLAGTRDGLGPYGPVVKALVDDLRRHRGKSLVIAGDHQPPLVHAIVHAINDKLGNLYRTVRYVEPIAAEAVEVLDSLGMLVVDMDQGNVELLIIIGGNPMLTAPANFLFAERLAKVGLRVHLGLHEDETSLLCHWHIPESHSLESWSDARAYDGTVTIMQPLIAPLYESKTAHELVATLAGRPDRSSYDIVRDHWRSRASGDFEAFWRRSVHDGMVADTAAKIALVAVRNNWFGHVPTALNRLRADADALEVVFRLDPTVFDGTFANNGWLQELPKPITKLTWDNAALMSPATAERLGLANEDVVELRHGEGSVRAPVWIVPGHANESVTLHLGYGRTRAGKVGTGAGFDAYALRTSATPTIGRGLEIHKTGERWPLACTQEHQSMEGRRLVRVGTLAEHRADPHFAHHGAHEPPPDLTLYPPHPYTGYAWGMAIDLGACTGCNACVIACQAENNIPVVGKDEVRRGREMHWIRVDRYFEGDLDEPAIVHQPVPCMHCENAPCEVVCPVNATVHSGEGLNEQIYNRCVGTKYCSNNCPYKVRRFNFFLYSDWTTESLKMGRNPDVTVRSRGVMEKCTYCVQRINYGRIQSEKEGRKIRDGEVVPACAQACPAEAIVFGDLNDPQSRVARMKAEPRNYGLLADLNTRPRTTYLASIVNPNPELERS